MITGNDINYVARYFDIASAWVPNQFSVFIYDKPAKTQINRQPDPNNPLYLLNLEPWTIEDITFPQIKFRQSNDIYMDAKSLIRPNYILDVDTSDNIEITVREKSDLAIYRSLIRCQTEMYNDRYEFSGKNVFGRDYSIVIKMKSQRFDVYTSDHENIFGDNVIMFDRVILSNISNPTLSYNDKSFMRYKVTFETSSMAETYIAMRNGNKSLSGSASFGNPYSSFKVTSATTSDNTVNSKMSSDSRSSSGLQIPLINELITSVANQIGNNVSKNINIGLQRTMDSYGNSIDSVKIDSSLKSTTKDVLDEVDAQSMADSAFNNAVKGAKNSGGVTGIGAKIIF